MKTCAFCAIVAGEAPAQIVREWPDAIAIRPRSGGCTDGHVFVISRIHVKDAGEDPDLYGAVSVRAGQLMAEHPAANILTSKGPEATQSIFHLHIHLVPRVLDDGLPLPWTPQHAARAAIAAAQNGATT
ncbi:HIT domain-containing protein (plasmid) [Streptomyces sp. NBC_01525]|uniref:HIT family protein n=1 Tax=Streptomyces sp. NBC_01525 TaxID=2903893 RepID=UPI002F90B2AC